MTITLHKSDQDIARHAVQALRALGPTTDGQNILTTAAIAGLTTVQQLIDLINNATRHSSEDELTFRAAIESILDMEKYGIFDGTIIAAADTFEGLIDAITSVIDAVEDPDATVIAKNYGATNYQGNIFRPTAKSTL